MTMFKQFNASVPCPTCDKLIHPGAVACRYCNTSFPSAIVPAARPQTGGSIGASLLSVCALLIAFFSWLFVSQATMGVAGLCFACLLGILARMAQAQHHQRMLMEHFTVRVE